MQESCICKTSSEDTPQGMNLVPYQQSLLGPCQSLDVPRDGILSEARRISFSLNTNAESIYRQKGLLFG